MTNYREILRLKALGHTHADIATACGCGRNTVTRTLAQAREVGLHWEGASELSAQEVATTLYPKEHAVSSYQMPDYAHVHREMQKSGVTRIITPDNLKTGVLKNTKTETVLNKTYQASGGCASNPVHY